MFGPTWHSVTAVTDCVFEGTLAFSGGSIGIVYAGRAEDADVRVLDSRFTNITAYSAAGCAGVGFYTHALRARVTLAGCTLRHATAGRSGAGIGVVFYGDAQHSHVRVMDCTFADIYAGMVGGGFALFVVGNATGAEVSVSRSTFADLRAVEGAGVHLVAAGGLFRATVRDCSFRRCRAATRASAVYASLARQESALVPIYCSAEPQTRRWEASSSLLVEGCTFDDVACTDPTCTGGAMEVAGGQLVLQRCNATRFAARAAGGFLRTTGSAGTRFVGSRLTHAAAGAAAFVLHEGAGALQVHGSLFSHARQTHPQAGVLTAPAASEQLEFGAGSLLACVEGETLVNASLGESQRTEPWQMDALCLPLSAEPRPGLVRVRTVDVVWQCVPCPLNTYYLAAGYMNDSRVLTGTCERCPFGATCHGGADVRANPGMWAPAVRVGELVALPSALLRCASEYCCRDAATCLRHDSCAGNRTGMLCGQCEPGSVGVLGSAACRTVEECGRAPQDVLFWPGSVLMLLGFAAWQVRAAASAGAVHDGSAGVIKVTVAFFQTFPLLLVGGNTASAAAANVNALLLQLFQLQLPGGSSGVCVMGGFTPVRAEAARVVMVLLLLTCALPLVWLAHLLAGWHGPAWLRLQPPRTHVYAGAMTALVMLTYSVITGAVTKLLACVDVPEHGSRLLIQGDVRCWSSDLWLQWLAAAWGVTNTLFVPLAVVLAGRQLRQRAISARRFWLWLALPLPCALLWSAQRLSAWRRSDGPSRGAGGAPTATSGRSSNATLRALCSGYRPATWWWDAVLLLRRLLLSALPLVLHAAPLLHAVVALVLVTGFFAAHARVHPLSSPLANMLETGYLGCLLLTAGLSVRSSTLITESVVARRTSHDVVLSVTVAALLIAVPAAAALHVLWRTCRTWLPAGLCRWCTRGPRSAAPVAKHARSGTAAQAAAGYIEWRDGIELHAARLASDPSVQLRV